MKYLRAYDDAYIQDESDAWEAEANEQWGYRQTKFIIIVIN